MTVRQLTLQQVDSIADAIHTCIMIASVVCDDADEMTRKGEGEDWNVPARAGERLNHFAFEQLRAMDDLREVFRAAVRSE